MNSTHRPWARRILIMVVATVFCGPPAGADDDRRDPHSYHSVMLFLCEWSATHSPPGQPPRMHICDAGDLAYALTPSTLDTDERTWWDYWRDQDPALYERLYAEWKADWNAHIIAIDKQKADALRAAQRKSLAEQKAKIPTMSIPKLCAIARGSHPTDAYAELERRSAFTPSDLKLIAAKAFAIGMTEDAMRCVMGTPERANRSVGNWGVDIQYIYGNTYIYTRNGKITSWQD